MTKTYRRYDHRLRNLVAESGDIDRFVRLGIPISTVRGWLKDGPIKVCTIPELALATDDLVQQNLALQSKLDAANAQQELVLTTVRVFGFQIQFKRLANANDKQEIIAAIKKAASIIPLSACLSAIGLSAARYHSWIKRQVKCLLADHSSCPRVSPTRLTSIDMNKIRDLYTCEACKHFSITSLSWQNAIGKAKALGLTLVPNILVDDGSENCNEHIDRLIANGFINRTIAQIDVEFSNSMVEMVFHRLKHRFLFNIPLTNFEVLVKAVNFYFAQSNEMIPQAVLKGATPLEVFTGQWTDIGIESIKETVKVAIANRIQINKAEKCLPCLT